MNKILLEGTALRLTKPQLLRNRLLNGAANLALPLASMTLAFGVSLSTDAYAGAVTVNPVQTTTYYLSVNNNPVTFGPNTNINVQHNNTGTTAFGILSGTLTYNVIIQQGAKITAADTEMATALAYGLRFPGSATVTNAGSITATAAGGVAGAAGIYTDTAANVTNSGAITVNATGVGLAVANAIEAKTTANVNNSGTINATSTTAGGSAGAAGIFAAIASTTTNSGTINATAIANAAAGKAESYGILAVTANATNSGVINATTTTVGGLAQAFGIDAQTANVSNSGAINATATSTGGGAVANGIHANIAANVTNSGSITATAIATGGGKALAIGIDPIKAIVNNSGTITASATGGPGSASVGIVANTATIINSGLIKGGVAIVAGGGGIGSTLVNSGTLIGTTGVAIDLSGTSATAPALGVRTASSNDSLTFLPGSRVMGAILLGTSDSVSVQSGRGVSTLLSFGQNGANGITATGSTLSVSGSTPIAFNGNQVATLDPTALALADRTLLDFTGGMSSLIQSRLAEIGEPNTASGSLRVSYAPEANANFPVKAPRAGTFDQGMVVWVNGFGGERVQDARGVDLSATNVFTGGAIGLDWQAWQDLRFGAFIGGGFSRLNVDQNSQRIDTDSVTGGIYSRYEFGARFVDFTLFGGGTHNSSTRQVFNNLAPNGIDSATASFNGGFITPELAYGWHIPTNNGWVWTPAARVRYVAGWFDGFSETGSAQNLSVNARSVQDLEGRLELALATTQPFGQGLLGVQLKSGVIGLTRLGTRNIDINLIGQGVSFSTPGDTNAIGAFTGVQFDYRIKQNVNMFVNVEGQALSDSSFIGTARGGIEIKY